MRLALHHYVGVTSGFNVPPRGLRTYDRETSVRAVAAGRHEDRQGYRRDPACKSIPVSQFWHRLSFG
jgi:hypothetical protein